MINLMKKDQDGKDNNHIMNDRNLRMVIKAHNRVLLLSTRPQSLWNQMWFLYKKHLRPGFIK